MQFRPGGPPQQGQQFLGPGGQQFRPGVGMGPPQQLGVPPSMQAMNPQQAQAQGQFPARPPQQPQGQPAPQGSGMPFGVQPRPITSAPQPPQAQQQQPSSQAQQQQQPAATPPPPGPGNHALQPASSYPVRMLLAEWNGVKSEAVACVSAWCHFLWVVFRFWSGEDRASCTTGRREAL